MISLFTYFSIYIAIDKYGRMARHFLTFYRTDDSSNRVRFAIEQQMVCSMAKFQPSATDLATDMNKSANATSSATESRRFGELP